MTEQQLRQQVADVMTSWLGASRGSATHLEILRIYNTHTPLARGYKVQVNDAYCATTASAAYISVGMADYTGTECGCDKFIEIAKAKGIWIEDDGYAPRIGDAVFYDWDDSGSGDNRGSADHVGIVVQSSGSSFTVVEGNGSGGKVVKRVMTVNGRYIRGFLAPPYAQIAAKTEPPPIADDPEPEYITREEAQKIAQAAVQTLLGPMIDEIDEIPLESVKAEIRELLDYEAIDGGTDYDINPDDLGLPLNIVRALVGCVRFINAKLAGKQPKNRAEY